jgi:ABC-type transport system substrate-binding protein
MSVSSSARTVVAAVLLLLAAGCGSRDERRVLQLALQSDPTTLDPALAVDIPSGSVIALLHTGLVSLRPDGTPAPGVARSWEISPDGTVYTFHLDPRRRFANGRPVTAEDVRWSFERVLSQATASPRTWVLERIRGARAFREGDAETLEGLRVEARDRVVIELERPFAPFLGLLAMPAAAVVPREEVERLGAEYGAQPVGCGPWRLVEWKRNQSIHLEPDSAYGDPVPLLDGIRIRILPEASTRVAELETGRLDILEVPTAELPRWRRDPPDGASLESVAALRVCYLGFQNRTEPFTDPRVRRALNYALDREAVLEKVLHGAGVLAAGSIPPGLPGGGGAGGGYRYDPQEARRLLAEAGLAGGFETEIWQRENAEVTRILEAVQGYWSRVGVEVRIVSREWTAFKEAVNQGSAPVFYLDWHADYPDAENFLYPLFHSSNLGGGGNRAFFSHRGIDSLLETAHRTIDRDARVSLYARIERRVVEEAPWVFLWFPEVTYAVSDRISGFRPSPIYLGNRYLEVDLGRGGAP